MSTEAKETMTEVAYVLITPARNEEAHIEKTIESVLAQSVRPVRWAIVDDGSTDRTGEIVGRYAAEHDFIDHVRTDPGDRRSFASKSMAVRTGEETLRGFDYAFIGNLDADISLEPDYYERLLAEFGSDDRLGVASGIYLEEIDGAMVTPLSSVHHTAGSIQLFRRECFEAIGGYLPLKLGGEDSIANMTARMKGWETRAYPELKAIHHRYTGTGDGANAIRVKYREGMQDYYLGTHPVFSMLKSLRRYRERPFLLGSVVRAIGFFRAWFFGDKRQISDELVRFIRREQKDRLRGMIKGDREKARLA